VAPAAAQTDTTLPAIPSGIEQITAYHVDLTVEPEGTLLVHEQIVYQFGVVPRHGIYRDVTDRVDYPARSGYDRVYPIDVVSVTASAGAPAQYTTEEDGDHLRIKIGDPDRTISGEHTYDITYRVEGALNGFADHDELVWNAIGNDWSVPISAVTVVVKLPAEVQRVGCAYAVGPQCPTQTAQACASSRFPD
jgi:hypothetical protein